MNESGRAVAEAVNFYKLEPADRSWCFTTRPNCRPPRLRLKLGGGNAGHNGLVRSISEHIGNDYHRVRLGIGHPGDKKLMEALRFAGFRQRRTAAGWRPSVKSSPIMSAC